MRKKNVAKWMVVLAALVAVSTSLIAGTLAKYSSEFAGSDTALVAKWELTVAAGQLGILDIGEPAIMGGSGGTELDLFGHAFDQHVRQRDGDEGKFIIAPGVEGEFFLVLLNMSDVAAEIDLSFAELHPASPGDEAVPIEYNVLDLVFSDDPNEDGEYILQPNPTMGEWIPLKDLTGAIVAQVYNAVEEKRHVSKFVEVVVDGDDKKIVLLPNDDHEKNIFQIIKWRWAYEKIDAEGDLDQARDQADTLLGTKSAEAAKTDARTPYGIKIDVTATQAQPGITQQP